MAIATEKVVERQPLTKEERMVIVASSVGTVFEWYDFYLYATLAPFFAKLFFPPGNETAALLSAFAAYAAGFLVRPFGALVFGRIGDLIGRKYTFLVTIVVMGLSTFGVGLLPTFPTIGWLAPIIMVTLRLCQGLALGGEYGGAATYVAEHSAHDRRGYNTSWIQTTATVGFFLCLGIILACRLGMKPEEFASWGWRIPFWMSIGLLGVSIWIRLKLSESPVFQKMKAEGKTSKAPLSDSFLKYPNNKYALLALLGATAGQGVVWYTGQFYALFFMQITLKLDFTTTYLLIGVALLLGTPFFIFFGWLSDKIGRLKIILAGCLIAACTFIPLFKGLMTYVNPALKAFRADTNIQIAARPADESVNIFVGPWSKFTEVDRVYDVLTKQGLDFSKPGPEDGRNVVVTIGPNPNSGSEKPTIRIESLASATEKTGQVITTTTAKDGNKKISDWNWDGKTETTTSKDKDKVTKIVEWNGASLTTTDMAADGGKKVVVQNADAIKTTTTALDGTSKVEEAKADDKQKADFQKRVGAWKGLLRPAEANLEERAKLEARSHVDSYTKAKVDGTLKEQGCPEKADPKDINYPMTLLILFIMLIYVTMVYGPIAAFLVELFPTNIRYTSMSLPYHIGNGWFGGMLPLIATVIVALKGSIYAGLWYPIIVALITTVIGFLFLKETKDRDISTYQHEK